MTSDKYINSFGFHHLTTYSFNRVKNLSEVYLTDEHGIFHSTAKSIKTLLVDSDEALLLQNILLTPAEEVGYWMCAPIYRDAIVFYNADGQIISILNVCLACSFMRDKYQRIIDGDDSMYPKLKEFFKNIGHEIEPDNILTI